jgi:hypothetical protein
MRANRDRLGVSGGSPRKQKNLQLVNGLASFDIAVDCAGANNRLKRSNLEFEVRPYRCIAGANFGCQGNRKP